MRGNTVSALPRNPQRNNQLFKIRKTIENVFRSFASLLWRMLPTQMKFLFLFLFLTVELTVLKGSIFTVALKT